MRVVVRQGFYCTLEQTLKLDTTFRPASTGLDDALLAACGLTQMWNIYRSWSHIACCLWLDPDVEYLQVLITHCLLPVAWPRCGIFRVNNWSFILSCEVFKIVLACKICFFLMIRPYIEKKDYLLLLMFRPRIIYKIHVTSEGYFIHAYTQQTQRVHAHTSEQ